MHAPVIADHRNVASVGQKAPPAGVYDVATGFPLQRDQRADARHPHIEHEAMGQSALPRIALYNTHALIGARL